jgi:hypothetical protein
LRAPLNNMSPAPGFPGRFVNAVKLKKFSELLANFAGHMSIPPVAYQFVRSVRLASDCDVIGPFKPDDVIAAKAISGVTARFRVRFEREAKLVNRAREGIDVTDFCFDSCEVTHNLPFLDC